MKRMPQLRFSIRYDLRKVIPGGWSGKAPLELASGNSYSFHGDFANGWLPAAATTMLTANAKHDFKAVDGPAGLGKSGSKCKAKDERPVSRARSSLPLPASCLARVKRLRFASRERKKSYTKREWIERGHEQLCGE